MKKKIFSFLLSIVNCIFLLANPIDNTPVTRFSELVFNNNNWTIELIFPFGYKLSDIDSIIISAKNVNAKLMTTYQDGIKVIVITADSLSLPLLLDRSGGKLQSYTYSSVKNTVREDSLVWGDHEGATVGAPLEGASVCRFFGEINENDWQIDYIDNLPSLGLQNDTTGNTAEIKGILYDRYNNPVTQLKPGGYYFQFESNLNLLFGGNYTSKLFPTVYPKEIMFIKMSDFQEVEDTVSVDTINLPSFTPWTQLTQDIHINSECSIIISDVTDEIPENFEVALINYPNPFNSTTNFVVKIPDGVNWQDMGIHIYNSNGELIKKILLNRNISFVAWDGTDIHGNLLPSGAYYYTLLVGHKPVKNGSMILLK